MKLQRTIANDKRYACLKTISLFLPIVSQTIQDSLQRLNAAVLASGLINAAQWNYAIRLAQHRSGLQKPTRARASAANAISGPNLPKSGPLTKPTADVEAEPVTDRLIADLMIEQNWLTAYQADQVLAGRTKLNLGPYIITDFIGQGGMGQVFKGVHQFMDRVCAVKVLPTSKRTDESLDGFLREMRLQARLDHPNLVRAFDAGQDGNVHYLVTEFVPGMDLRKLIKSNGPLSVYQASSVIMQAANGLQYAHEQGLVHRDVKPGNVLVTPEGITKVSDVGLAGFAAELMADPRQGKIVGTADYLSPEQIRTPLEITAASDVYSLGCTLYYAICGKVPFPGGNTQSKLKRHLSETPWHPRRLVPAIPDEFVDIIADMMEKNFPRRTQTCAEVAARLEAWAVEPSNLETTQWSDSPWNSSSPNAEPWTAPPPNGINVERDSTGKSLQGETGEAALDTNHGEQSATHLSSGISMQSKPGIRGLRDVLPHFPNPSGSAAMNSAGSASERMSFGILVTLVVAIVVPPALLLGFIIGYLVKR